MKRFVLIGTALLTLSTSMAADPEIAVNVVVQSDNSVLQGGLRAAIVSRVRQLPHVTVVADDNHAMYTIQVVADEDRLGEQRVGWHSSYVFIQWTPCGDYRLPVFKAGGPAGGGYRDTEAVVATFVNSFDEILTRDRQK